MNNMYSKKQAASGVMPSRPTYALQQVKDPHLYREFFPYKEVPSVAFDGHVVPMNIPDDIFITDTTFRDGQQAREPFTIQNIVDIYTFLHRLGGYNGLIRQSEFFVYTARDREAVEKCRALDYEYPEVTAWIRATEKDLALARDMALKEVGILTSISDYHIFLKLKTTRQKACDQYLGIVKEALDAGLTPRCHFEDVTRADIYGCVLPFAQALRSLAEEARRPIKIRLCDTMGFAVPYAEAMLPRSVPKLCHLLTHDAGYPSAWLEWHGHNDFHKGLVNSTSAWLYGCSGVNATILGIGERTGNAPIEGLVIDYLSLVGPQPYVDTTIITEIAEYCEKELGESIRKNHPFIGAEFNVTRAGIHADGVLKNQEIYNIFDTERLLNRPMGVLITDKSGVAGIAFWVNSFLRLSGTQKLSKLHPGIRDIHEEVMSHYADGRMTSMSNEELLALARRHLPQLFESELDDVRARAMDECEKILQWVSENRKIISMKPDVIYPVLCRVTQENPFIQRMYVTDAQGTQITDNATSDELIPLYEKDNDIRGTDKSNREWIQKTIESEAIHISEFYSSRITHKLCFSTGVPILDYTDTLVGVIGADLDFEALARDVLHAAGGLRGVGPQMPHAVDDSPPHRPRAVRAKKHVRRTSRQ